MLKCNIVKDLLPGYIDSLISEETAREVKQHLDECDDCRLVYERMKAPIEAIPVKAEKKEVRFLKKIKLRYLRNTVIGIFIVALIAGAIGYFTWSGSQVRSRDITYSAYIGTNGEYILDIKPKNENKGLSIYTYFISSAYDGDDTRRTQTNYLIPHMAHKAKPAADKTEDQPYSFMPDARTVDWRIILRLADGDIVFTAKDFKR